MTIGQATPGTATRSAPSRQERTHARSLALSSAEWRIALRTVRRNIKRDRVTVAAGSFAYRWFLSLFPVIIALLGVTAAIGIPERLTVDLVHGVTKALPSGAASVFTTAIRQSQHRAGGAITTIVVAGLVALWSATSGMVIVEEGLDMAFGITTDRSFFAKRLVAVPLLIAAVVLGGGASALAVFGQSIGGTLKSHVPVAGTEFAIAWTALRWVAAVLLVGLLFSVIYWLAPNRPRRRWQWVTPGALVGTLLWAAISVGFSLYNSVSGSFVKTYGAFAGVALLIFWLYLTGIAILVGGAINAAFEQQSVHGAGGVASTR